LNSLDVEVHLLNSFHLLSYENLVYVDLYSTHFNVIVETASYLT